MKSWQNTIISPETSIIKALEVIDKGALQIALVVDDEFKLLGVVTDGDVRRGLLRGVTLNSSVKLVMNTKPKVVSANDNQELVMQLMRNNSLQHIPVLNTEGKVVAVEFLEQLLSLSVAQKENEVVLMAGGLGARLRPLTDNFPKPLLEVGKKPILETILENFIKQGFKNFTMCVNFRADLIEGHFKDGEQWGARIRYLHESKRMGTAGALGLLKEKPKMPFFVMNGDLLTNVNFTQLLQFHNEQQAMGTMCVRQYDYQIPYGVIQTKDQHLIKIDEKPIHNYFINAGIYVLNPGVLDFIPDDTFYDMTSLFEHIMQKDNKAMVFPIREYWLDIGQKQDFDRANEEYKNIFG